MSVVTRRTPPDEKYAEVNPVWQGETVAIIGGGPSLTQAQVDACRGLKCIAVNDAYLLAPWADAVYFADAKWFGWQVNGRDGKGHPNLGLSAEDVKRRWREFAGLKVSISNAQSFVKDPGVLFLKNHGEHGGKGVMSADPGSIATGSNSCYQALNIAILAGAKRILFIGLDGAARGGKRHWFGDHPDVMDPAYDAIRQNFRNAAPWCAERGIEVINCSPGTAIDHFPCMPLDEALAGVAAPAGRPIPPAPMPQPSVYVRASEYLRARDAASAGELAREFPAGLTAALRKGLQKGTFVQQGETWRHASRVVVAETAAVVSG